MACTLTFPEHFHKDLQDVFCQLEGANTSFPWSQYPLVNGAKGTKAGPSETSPSTFILDTSAYTHHPTSVHVKGQASPLDYYMGDAAPLSTVAVGRVESIGNGDQESFLDFNAEFGNLYLLTSPGWCQDLSPQMKSSRWRWDDFADALYELSDLQGILNGRGPHPLIFGFPKSVATAEETMPVIVTVLPGPAATHVPDELEGQPNIYRQGEWPLAWSAMVYSPAKPVLPTSGLPSEFQGTQFCSRVMEAHSGSTRIMQFTWNTAEVLVAGGLTVAHDINSPKTILRGDAAHATPSLFKITLVRQ